MEWARDQNLKLDGNFLKTIYKFVKEKYYNFEKGFYSNVSQTDCLPCKPGYYCDNSTTSEEDMLINKVIYLKLTLYLRIKKDVTKDKKI